MLRGMRDRLDRSRRPFPVEALRCIIALAKGDESQRKEAGRRASLTRVLCPHLRDHVALRFMTEVESPCPDLALRAAYRAGVLALPEAA